MELYVLIFLFCTYYLAAGDQEYNTILSSKGELETEIGDVGCGVSNVCGNIHVSITVP